MRYSLTRLLIAVALMSVGCALAVVGLWPKQPAPDYADLVYFAGGPFLGIGVFSLLKYPGWKPLPGMFAGILTLYFIRIVPILLGFVPH